MGGDSGAANLEGASCDEAEGKAAEGENETPGDCPEEVRSDLERISTTIDIDRPTGFLRVGAAGQLR